MLTHRKGFQRRPYTRSNGVHVRGCRVPPCKVGQRPVMFNGYRLGLPARTRHRILSKAFKADRNNLLRRLSRLRARHRDRPSNFDIIDRDIRWLKSKHASTPRTYRL